METLSRLMNLCAVPIMVLNLFGDVASGIWLAVLGEWGAIGYGIVAIVFSGFLLGFAFAPSMLIAMPGVKLAERGYRAPMYFFGFLSRGYDTMVIIIWVTIVFSAFLNRTSDASAVIPTLIWSYGVATAPIMWLASKEDRNSPNGFTAFVTTFFTQLGCLVLTIVAIIAGSFTVGLLAFIGVMLVSLFTSFAISVAMQQEIGHGAA